MSYYFPPQQKPARWGSFQDIQYAIRKNSEKVYGVDPDSNVLVMPLFFGFPCTDFSGKQNHGTPVGGVAYDGQALNCVLANGNYIEAMNSSTVLGNSVSIAIRLRINALKGANNEYLFRLSDGTTTERIVLYRGLADLLLYTPDDVNCWIADAETVISTYKWWDVVVTFIYGSVPKIYANGKLITPTTSLNITAQAGIDSFEFSGAGLPADKFLSASWQKASIHNCVLTAEQIALFYARPWDLYRRVGRTYYSIAAAAPSVYIPRIMVF